MLKHTFSHDCCSEAAGRAHLDEGVEGPGRQEVRGRVSQHGLQARCRNHLVEGQQADRQPDENREYGRVSRVHIMPCK